jgi:hypothetical protein
MSSLPVDGNGNSIQCLRPGATQSVSSTGTAGNATAVAAGVSVVRIVATAPIYYSLIGTATAASVYLPADYVEYISVKTGDVFSLIGTATVYITAMG